MPEKSVPQAQLDDAVNICVYKPAMGLYIYIVWKLQGSVNGLMFIVEILVENDPFT